VSEAQRVGERYPPVMRSMWSLGGVMMSAEQKSRQQVLNDLQDDLVLQAEKVVRELAERPREGSRQETAKSGKTQVSRAIDMAGAPGCTPRVFVNWLRYQAARETESSRFWTERLRGDRVADRVSNQVNSITQQVRAKLGASDSEAEMMAVARFLGYLRRALVGIEDLGLIALADSGGGSG